MQGIVTRVRARGLRIFGVTILPPQSSDWTAVKEQVRQQVNQWIRGETAFHGIIDFDNVLRDPANPSAIGCSLAVGQREHVERLSALWNLDIRNDRCRHVARAAAAETRHDADVLAAVDFEAHRESLGRRPEPRLP